MRQRFDCTVVSCTSVQTHKCLHKFQDLLNIDNCRYVVSVCFCSIRASTDRAVIKCVSPVDLSFNYIAHNAPAN